MALMTCSMPLLKNMPVQEKGDTAVSMLLYGASPPNVTAYLGLWDSVSGITRTAAQTQQRSSSRAKSSPCEQRDSRLSGTVQGLKELRIDSDRQGCRPNLPADCSAKKPVANTTQACRRAGASTSGKKRVTFADNLGYDLESVKLIYESSDTPPQLDPSIAAAAGAAAANALSLRLSFRFDSKQPVSVYSAFRERLARQRVSAESIAVNNDCHLLITIKVKNLAYEKRVFVRMTHDNWQSFKDLPAHYVGCAGTASTGQGSSTYDSFVLEADIGTEFPNASVFRPVEFAICYACNQEEYWDSNEGQNYRLVSARSSPLPAPITPPRPESVDCQWSDYAAWRYIEKDVPYW